MVAARLAAAARDPLGAWYALRARTRPDALYRRYARLAREAGLDRLYLVVSFDCDTDDDIGVAGDVHARLADMGVPAVFAVPGELLRAGEAVYRRIAEAGAEFINHGDRKHTYFDTALGRHASCFFYDQIGREAVRADVMAGDATLREVLGVAPRGFRTPHFGTFQRPAELQFLHGMLAGLGYAFSSSTVPLFGFRFGPVFRRFGVAELPVSGMGEHPLTTLDSWACFAAPDRVFDADDYRRQGQALAQALAGGGAGILNVYADPSHVHGRGAFFETVAAWRRIAEPARFSDLPGIGR